VLVVARDGRIRYLNAAAEQLLGISSNQACERRLPLLAPELAVLGPLILRAAATGESYGHELDLRPPYQQGQTVPVTGRMTPARIAGAGHVILELIDASHWRQIDREKALISQHDASRRVIAQLAHEIRNPLGGLRGAAQLLERELPTGELREYTRIIIGEADRLAALTDSLLGPARSLRREAVNIHEVVERVLALVSNESPPGLAFVRDYDPSLPPLTIDRDQVLQAILNILRNAAQALGERGRIVLRTRALTNYVIGNQRHKVVASIEVEDDGPGVPAELGDSIFYPLVSGRAGGTGLGLPLAQELISRHGGLIEYRSRPGQTVFMVRLPIETESAARLPGPPA
jgi:two-component system nitrogen regulation sensor histidine kinase GlnL